MFICEKNYSCCDFKYWDRLEDAEQEARECGHLIEVVPVVHGRWIERVYGEWYCGKCGYEIEGLEYHPSVVDRNYCPNCGAKMDGGE